MSGPGAGQPIEVAIVEDDAPTREGLAMLLEAAPDLRCASRFGSVEEALRAAGPPPDLVLLDVHLPGLCGAEGVAALLQKHPRATILMLSAIEDQDQVFESICRGAAGYLLKKTPPARLLEAIREAHQGGAPMSPEIARKVICVFRELRPLPRTGHGLSGQQIKVLALLADGHSYLSAAGQLGISINTVRNHVRATYDVLHVHSKGEAVSKAIKRGII